MGSIAYRCIKCDCRVTVERVFQPLPGHPFYVRCPLCGLACMPEKLLEGARDARGNRDWETVFRWSKCPSAYQCELRDYYDERCEEGQIMPKCLNVIRERIEDAERRNPAPAQPQPPARRKSRARGKTGQQNES